MYAFVKLYICTYHIICYHQRTLNVESVVDLKDKKYARILKKCTTT